MVYVGDTGHNDEGEVVKEPPNGGIDGRIVDMVHLCRGKLRVSSLPSHHVPDDQDGEHAEAGGRAPVDQGVSEEEVFDNLVVPSTHAKTDVEDRPLPPLRS